jgi:hypothetical protein
LGNAGKARNGLAFYDEAGLSDPRLAKRELSEPSELWIAKAMQAVSGEH